MFRIPVRYRLSTCIYRIWTNYFINRSCSILVWSRNDTRQSPFPVQMHNKSNFKRLLTDEIKMLSILFADVGCVCAWFDKRCPSEDDIPLMSETLHNVTCHQQDSGEDACTKACVSFVLRSGEMKDSAICSLLGHATHIMVSLMGKGFAIQIACRVWPETVNMHFYAKRNWICKQSIPLISEDAFL